MTGAARPDGPLADPASLDVVRAAYAAFARGDGDGFVELFAEDSEVIQWDGFPWGGRACGKEEVRGFAQRAARHIRSHARAEELFIAGEDVIAIGRSKGTVLATQRPFDVRIVHRWRIEAGKIRLWHLLVEAAPLLEALAADHAEGDGASA